MRHSASVSKYILAYWSDKKNHIIFDFARVKIWNMYIYIFTGPTYNLRLSFVVIYDVYMSFIPNKSTFTKHCRTPWISKFLGSFGQYLVYFLGLVDIANTTVYKTEPILTGVGHDILSQLLTLLCCMQTIKPSPSIKCILLRLITSDISNIRLVY